MDFAKYLGTTNVCGCGREHRCDIESILVERGALQKLPGILKNMDYRKMCVVMDENTKAAAGDAVCKILTEMQTDYVTIVLEGEEPVPDERILGGLLVGIPQDCDFLIAVGSGVINDLCKLMAYKLRLEYMIVATAPSMDGYASNVSPVIIKNTKTTYEARMPKIILADVDIMSQAPMDMITAGVGDILGKYICLMDWRLANLVNGEYYCEYAQQLVQSSIEKVMHGIEHLTDREPQSIASVMEGLILSGICMSYIGNSRPASGSEHHMSHFWEMTALEQGGKDAFHGTKVAVGTVISLKMYEILKGLDWSKLHEHPAWNRADWEKAVKTAYGKAAPTVVALEEVLQKNMDEAVRRRRRSLLEKEKEIRSYLDTLPSSDSIAAVLKKIGAPYKPSQIHVSDEVLRNSIYFAKDLRDRFGLLQVVYDNDLQEMMFQEITAYCNNI